MRLVRKSLPITSITVVTRDNKLCVKLLNKGYAYQWIAGKTHSLIKQFHSSLYLSTLPYRYFRT